MFCARLISLSFLAVSRQAEPMRRVPSLGDPQYPCLQVVPRQGRAAGFGKWCYILSISYRGLCFAREWQASPAALRVGYVYSRDPP